MIKGTLVNRFSVLLGLALTAPAGAYGQAVEYAQVGTLTLRDMETELPVRLSVQVGVKHDSVPRARVLLKLGDREAVLTVLDAAEWVSDVDPFIEKRVTVPPNRQLVDKHFDALIMCGEDVFLFRVCPEYRLSLMRLDEAANVVFAVGIKQGYSSRIAAFRGGRPEVRTFVGLIRHAVAKAKEVAAEPASDDEI